jgi:hypothetical protein
MAEDGNNQLAGGNNDDGGDDIFVYTGGEQEVPRDVTRARIDESVDTIPRGVFRNCEVLIEVEGHDKLKKIEVSAFYDSPSLKRVTKMNGVRKIENHAFYGCTALSDLEFDKLEIVGRGAFGYCESLRSINLPYVRRIGNFAFHSCKALTDAVFGKDLFEIGGHAFNTCTSLRRIAIPLKNGLIVDDDAFRSCANLSRVDAVGGIHKTISSLHMESWRDEMMEKIDQINQALPAGPRGKVEAINRWIRSVLPRMMHYKVEHKVLVKEAMTLLELALWKAKLLNEEGVQCETEEEKMSQKAKIDASNCTRVEHRVTCGANIVIKNVLPFLALKK